MKAADPARLQAIRDTAREIFGDQDDASVERWIEYWRSTRERNLELMESFRPLVALGLQGRRVLDIGCGAGGLGELISQQCQSYVGGDSHMHVLRFARPARGRHYLCCSGLHLPFPDESFDWVVAFDVIEHLVGGKEWQIRFLQEIRRVLSPVGMALLTTPNRWHPYEGHSRLYFPQYLPLKLANRYIAWRNPGFLKEHKTFAEIQLLGPGGLKRCLRRSGLAFLHELPCGLDRKDYRKIFPWRGVLASLGLGWLPHAEFWGILVRKEERARLRRKLKPSWTYEGQRPDRDEPDVFGDWIDFDQGLFNKQLGPGWYWHEKDRQGFRWIQRTATCYLEPTEHKPYLIVRGYSPRPNKIEFRVEGLRIGEHQVQANQEFCLRYLIPNPGLHRRLLRIDLACESAFRPSQQDPRELGVMIFSLGLSASFRLSEGSNGVAAR